jgi:hypothetical protein
MLTLHPRNCKLKYTKRRAGFSSHDLKGGGGAGDFINMQKTYIKVPNIYVYSEETGMLLKTMMLYLQ